MTTLTDCCRLSTAAESGYASYKLPYSHEPLKKLGCILNIMARLSDHTILNMLGIAIILARSLWKWLKIVPSFMLGIVSANNQIVNFILFYER